MYFPCIMCKKLPYRSAKFIENYGGNINKISVFGQDSNPTTVKVKNEGGAGMIISPQSLDTNLSQLLAEVKSGSMQLPEFQRDWTWDDNRIKGIIASLSQGYPMGAIMRLQYGNPDIQFKYRTITGVKGVSVKPEHLILDGQQRLTSIYQATFSKDPVSTKTEKGKAIKRYYYLSMEKCLDDDEDRFDAVLSIPEDRKIKENFDRDVKLDLSTREYEYENKLFPVNIVFDSNAVMDWFMGYMTFYGMKPEAMDEFKRFQADVLNGVQGFRERQYRWCSSHGV